MLTRYLTKSCFKLALECPVKLYYTGKSEFPDTKQDNSFLEALADGGFQVGALAKLYYPGGVEITDKGYDVPVAKTDDLLKNENVVIFEGAFRFKNLFIRADIVEKRGNNLRLIEVKSKSFEGDDYNDLLGKKGFLTSGWKEYLYDVAFQKYVITKAYPQLKVTSFLMLADKTKKASVDGLNQKFFLEKGESERTVVKLIGDTSPASLGDKILVEINVDQITEMIYSGTDHPDSALRGKDFVTMVHDFADDYEKGIKINSPIGDFCSDCQFTCSENDEMRGLQSGFKTCWSEKLNWTNNEFQQPSIFELWNFRGKQKLMDKGIYHLKDISETDLGKIVSNSDGTLSPKERQLLQINRTTSGDSEPYFDKDGFRSEMSKWKFPLHFIDFETSMVAIPFNKGRKPYEGIAFQYSHHIIYKNGKIEHKGQYLNIKPGIFPNFDFIENLKSELDKDDGTIFKYAAHENTFLNMIYSQLRDTSDKELPNRQILMDFIKSISHSKEDSVEKWQGERDMVDMLELVRNYFWQLEMKGSNSIKVVLPTVLKISDFIKNKYSQPIYGTSDIDSHNFKNFIWYKTDENGIPKNPYKLLPPLFDDLDQDTIENLVTDDSIADGGAAMTAYARMQFTEMSDSERQKVAKGLYRYCELDTLAMVMIYEYWNDIVNR
jgi:hypothetical protein